MALKVRPLTAEEADALKRCASARSAPHRIVQRTQLAWASAHGTTVPAIARQSASPHSESGPGSIALTGTGSQG